MNTRSFHASIYRREIRLSVNLELIHNTYIHRYICIYNYVHGYINMYLFMHTYIISYAIYDVQYKSASEFQIWNLKAWYFFNFRNRLLFLGSENPMNTSFTYTMTIQYIFTLLTSSSSLTLLNYRRKKNPN